MTLELRQLLNNEGQKVVEAGGSSFVFIHGYKTFINNLWHDVDEPHDENKLLIIKLISGQFAFHRGSFKNIGNKFGICEATEHGSEAKGIVNKWMYFDDIIPDNNSIDL